MRGSTVHPWMKAGLEAQRGWPCSPAAQRAGAAAITLLAAWLLALAPAARAATPLRRIGVSPDTTVVLGGLTVTPQDVAEDDLAGSVTVLDIGVALPGGVRVTAYEELAGGEQLLSFDTSVALPGGLTVGPTDIVRFDGSVFTLVFDGPASDVPAGAHIDAVSVAAGDLLISFDTAVVLNGATAEDEDLLRAAGGGFTLFFDGSAAGVPTELDLDGAQYLDANANLLLSFDGSGNAGGVAFDDEDVLEYDPSAETWELAHDGSAAHAGWGAADLAALSAAPVATPTPTRTVTRTPTATATRTPTRTETAVSTATASPITTATASYSPSRTPTPTASATQATPPTGTASGTATPTATHTAATPPPATATATATRTATATPSATTPSTPEATATETATSPAGTPTLTPPATPTVTVAVCVGDCDGGGSVTIDELIKGVNIALGSTALDACDALDRTGDGTVTIDELIAAVNNALTSCTGGLLP